MDNKISIDKELIERISRQCHEANALILCTFEHQEYIPWESISQDLKDNTTNSIYEAIRWMHSGNILTPAAIHNFWMDHKKSQGWKYGSTKCAVHKTHPLLVPYEELSPVDQFKDINFINIINNFAVANPGVFANTFALTKDEPL